MKLAVQVDQKAAQVTYDYTVSGVFSADPSANRDIAVGLCYAGATADKNDCILLKQSLIWTPGLSGTISGITNYVYRAIDVTDTNAAHADWAGNVIDAQTSDGAKVCGKEPVKAATAADPWTTWTHTAPATATNLCDSLSMDKDKQGYKEKTFTIQATVTDAASADETAAVALLTAFKTAAATMKGGLQTG